MDWCERNEPLMNFLKRHPLYREESDVKLLKSAEPFLNWLKEDSEEEDSQEENSEEEDSQEENSDEN